MMNIQTYIEKFIGYRNVERVNHHEMFFNAFLIACMHESDVKYFEFLKI